MRYEFDHIALDQYFESQYHRKHIRETSIFTEIANNKT